MEECIFCKIIKKEIPSTELYQDERTYAFLDIHPIHEGHALIIPKKHSTNLLEMEEADLLAVMKTAQKMAKALMKSLKAEGFNVGMNNYEAGGQLVMHSHLHIIPRFKNDGLRHWQGKKYEGDKEKEVAELVKSSL